jgi:RNA polymerase sigma factor (sigma-70 family)
VPDWPMTIQVQIAFAARPPRDRDAVDRIVEWLADGPQAVWSRRLAGAILSRRLGKLVTPEDVSDASQDFLCGPARTVAERFDATKGRSFSNYLGWKIALFAKDRAEKIWNHEKWLHRPEQTTNADVIVEVVDMSDQQPDHIAELRAFVSAWEAALNKVSAEYLEVYLCCVVKGWTHEKVALELGIRVPTVGTKLRRARLHLKKLLQSGGWADA